MFKLYHCLINPLSASLNENVVLRKFNLKLGFICSIFAISVTEMVN